MDKKESVEHTISCLIKSSRMVAYMAAAVALFAVACWETNAAAAPVSSTESCDEFHYEGSLGNVTYTQYTAVCENAKTKFGIVRDKKTGYIINTFFTDYKQSVGVVYLTSSHQCLLSHELGSFDDALDIYRNFQYDHGPFPYSIGEEVDAWEEIPRTMRSFCSPQNTFRGVKHDSDADTDLRSKRDWNDYTCCCFLHPSSDSSWWLLYDCTSSDCLSDNFCWIWSFMVWDTPQCSGGICAEFGGK